MLGKLVSRLRDRNARHPLGSDRALEETLASIRHAEPEWELLDVVQWLELLAEGEDGLEQGAVIRAAERLDAHAQRLLAAVSAEYFNPDGRNRGSDKAWNTMSAYCRAAWAAYGRCLGLIEQQPREASDPRLLARLAGRAMRAWVTLKKLGRFRYRGADPGWWREAHALLARGRRRNITQVPVLLYSGEVESSLWREYLVGVYFEVSPVDSLDPQAMEMVDCLLRRLGSCLVCRDRAMADERWGLDVASETGPFRRDPDGQYGATVGVIGFDMLRGATVRLIAELRAQKNDTVSVPPWLLATHCTRRGLMDLLLNLTLAWSAKPPERRAPRNARDGEVLATFGFSLLRRLVSCSALARSGRHINYDSDLKRQREARYGYAERLEMRLGSADEPIPEDPLSRLQKLELMGEKQMMEGWKLRDLSDSGLGVLLPVQQARHAIGALVGYRFADEVDWNAAILRRLYRDPQGRMSAGLERLPGPPVCAQVRLMKLVDRGPWQDVVEVSGHGLTDAILLEQSAHQLLVPAGFFRSEEPIRITAGGTVLDARMMTCLAAGDGFELVAYRVLHPAHTAEITRGIFEE